MATEFEVDQIYRNVLNRPFNDGAEVLQTYSNMTPEEITEFVTTSPEGQFAAQFNTELGRPIRSEGRSYYMDQLVNQNVPIGDLLNYIANSPEALAYDNLMAQEQMTTDTLQEQADQQAQIDAGFSPFEFSAPNVTEVINPNTPTVNMQITGGSQILPTPTNLGFYGVNPTTGLSELLPQMVKGNEMYNPMFKAGVGGFTDVLPYQFDFGIPAVNANVPFFDIGGGANFLDAKEAKAIADAEAQATYEANNPRFSVTHG
tara:strand:+ start:2930 stop:3706 length:777 start_codon:yes stop_codon:yes gene_type:complete